MRLANICQCMSCNKKKLQVLKFRGYYTISFRLSAGRVARVPFPAYTILYTIYPLDSQLTNLFKPRRFSLALVNFEPRIAIWTTSSYWLRQQLSLFGIIFRVFFTQSLSFVLFSGFRRHSTWAAIPVSDSGSFRYSLSALIYEFMVNQLNATFCPSANK